MLFKEMLGLIKNKTAAQWIPDFMLVWIELMYRNSKEPVIKTSTFSSMINVITQYKDLESANNAFPLTFIIYAILKDQDET